MSASKRSRKATAPRASRRPAELAWTKSADLTVPGGEGRPVTVTPIVAHSVADPPALHLGGRANREDPHLTHTFRVGFLSEDLGDVGTGSPGPWNVFPSVSPPWELARDESSFRLVAELELYEFPVGRVEEFG